MLRHLRRAGLRPLALRLRTREAELDLVLLDGDQLVVVEVKAGRAGPRFRPAERHRRASEERQAHAAGRLASELGARSVRLVLAEVRCHPGRPPELVLLPARARWVESRCHW